MQILGFTKFLNTSQKSWEIYIYSWFQAEFLQYTQKILTNVQS